tara:strand:+ start:210 stop:437 length:228 start_codon:yes stop_codon:yes gene_type:complete
MEYRVFINYDGLSPPDWIDPYLKENLGEWEDQWWSQCVTDNWETNTNCYYFHTQEDADKFEFISKLCYVPKKVWK